MTNYLKKLYNMQQIRFLFVGGLNTLVGYGIYALCIFFGINYFIANLISTVIGVIHSYIWNKLFTFKSKNTVKKEVPKFISVYLISFLISNLILYIFITKLGANQYIGGLINIVLTTIISWFGHKYFSFRNVDLKALYNKLKNKVLDMKKPSKFLWALLVIVTIFCYVTFNHGDITATATHGKDLLDLTLRGQFFNFYDYTQSTAVYYIPLYIIFAIWSIPVYIVYAIFNIPMWGVLDYSGINFFLLMWYKLLPVLFTLGTALILYKIGIYVGMKTNKAKWMVFVFLSFPILIFSQYIFGQYDSICMFFTTLALYYYLQKKYYKFSGIMAIAATLKLFPLFIFIPLILLVEKRVIHIIKYLAIGVSGVIVSNLLFINSPAFNTAKDFAGGMIDRFFASGVTTSYGVLSYFLILFLGVCVFAYLKYPKEKYEYIQWATYIPLVVYSFFFMFILWHPQWAIILVPFLVLSMFINNNNKISIILNILLSIAYILLVVSVFTNNVDELLINMGVMPLLFNKTLGIGGKLQIFFGKIPFMSTQMYMTLFFGCLLINLILKYPKKEIIAETKNNITSDTIEVDKGYILVQLFTILLYIVPTLYLFIRYVS